MTFSKLVAIALLVFLGAAALFVNVGHAETYTCKVVAVGAAANGNIYIRLDDYNNRWAGEIYLFANSARKNEQLAIAMAAIEANKKVWVVVSGPIPPASETEISNLFLTNMSN